MKPILITLVIWLTFIGAGNPVWAQTKWAVSVSVSPLYSHSNVKQNIYFPDYITNGAPVLTHYSVRSTGDGYSVGILGRYSISTHWSATSGIGVSHIWSKVPTIQTDPHIDIQATAGRSRNYQIPLLINYQTSTKRLAPYFSAGLQLSFRSLSFLPINGQQDVRVRSGGKLLTVIPIIGAGISYQLSTHLALLAQPTLRYSIPDSEVIYARLYQVSLLTQLLYKFQ